MGTKTSKKATIKISARSDEAETRSSISSSDNRKLLLKEAKQRGPVSDEDMRDALNGLYDD